MFVDQEYFTAVVEEIAGVREYEIGCEECYEQVDLFVDLVHSGFDAAQLMPLVQQHLELCDECREEFEVLLEALRATGYA